MRRWTHQAQCATCSTGMSISRDALRAARVPRLPPQPLIGTMADTEGGIVINAIRLEATPTPGAVVEHQGNRGWTIVSAFGWLPSA